MRLVCVVLYRLVVANEFFFTLSNTQKEKSLLAVFSGVRFKHVKYVEVSFLFPQVNWVDTPF